MGRTSSLLSRLSTAFIFCFDTSKNTLTMACPRCKSINIKTMLIMDSTEFDYSALCECKTCGAVIEETQQVVQE